MTPYYIQLEVKQYHNRAVVVVVSVLAFYSDDPSLNPDEAYSFFLQNLGLKRKKIYKKRPRMANLKKQYYSIFEVRRGKKYSCAFVRGHDLAWPLHELQSISSGQQNLIVG